jgi:5'(3')-deoxyribonucleotidase
MTSHKRRTPIEIDDMPPGWAVTHVEHRGYDSPDRELVATHPTYATCYAPEEAYDRLRREAWLRHPQIKTIFLDVDEVLVDWVGATLELLGYDPADVHARWSEHDPRPWDLFAVIDHTPSQAWQKIDAAGADFWAHLPLLPGAQELYETCRAFAPTVLLTSPSLCPSSHAGKAAWMKTVFGRDFRDYLIGSVKHRCAHPGALLIDDSPKNCAAFREHGGHAILFPGCGNELYAMPVSARLYHVAEQLRGYRR